MNTLLQDLKFSLRLLTKTPGFTIAAVLVLALGIGVNTAIFSMVHELVYSPRPWPAEKEVVQLYTQDEITPKKFRMFSYPAYKEIQEGNTSFTDIMAHNLMMVGVGEGENARRTFGATVSANYFSTLQVPLLRGRGFLAEEERPGAAVPVVVASYNYWKRVGLPADFVGSTVRINERPFTVVGITPEGFSGTMMLFGPELYFPLGCFDILNNDFGAEGRRTLDRSDAYNLFLVGRLKPGVAMADAEPGLKALAVQLRDRYPEEMKEKTFTLRALPRLSTSNAPAEEKTLSMLGVTLISMAAIVLLIASLNLANMLLARGTARRKEFAIRLALGGGRGRIVRQLLTEGFVLALAGGAAGFVLGTWSTGILMKGVGAMAPVSLFFKGAGNPALFGATFGFCALATVLFALGPALKLSRGDVLTDLKDNAGEDTTRRRRRWLPRNPLVVAQLALSLGLLTAAGLFIRGALAAGGVETGFHAEGTLLVETDATLGGYDEARATRAYASAAERIAAIPGVQSASISSVVPFGMVSIDRAVLRAGLNPAKDSKPATPGEGLAFNARWSSVGADYFSTMGLPILRGRAFNSAETETPGAPAVAIIDEALARKLWPEGDALGQHIQFAERDAPKAEGGGNTGRVGSSESIAATASDPKSIEIVGIVPNTRWELFAEIDGGTIFVPYAQGFQSNVFFHVRTANSAIGAEAAMLDAIRRELRTVAPGVPVLTTTTFGEHLDGSFQIWIVRVGAAMFSVFGVLALMLAAVGLYGVKAYSVARRTREIGIRMAIGAAPGAVQSMILREGAAMIAVGVALGMLIGLGLGQALAGMLYKVSPFDPVAFVGAPIVLAAVAVFACYLPARRATRVNPLTALRAE
ncbi:MAG TPA: ABC transporter permease [Opitutaceae bacterium]|nr:ABC transporter permease [Opitutaceae bacterium]